MAFDAVVAKSPSVEMDSEIVALDCIPVRLPLRKPITMASGRINDAPILFVRLRSRNGAEGWGEAAANPLNAGETLRGMKAVVEDFISPRLLGTSAHDRVRLSHELRSSIFSNGGALAAVDMALLDLAGKLRNVPAAELLGGFVRRKIMPVSIIGGSGRTDEDVAQATALYDEGARAFKLKVGVADVHDEIETIATLRRALGHECLIAADANMAWDTLTAIQFARGTVSSRLAYLEQPVAADVARTRRVADASPVPIGVDESVHGVSDILSLAAAGAIAGATFKSIKVGGMAPLVSIATVADAIGLSVGLAMMMETSLATAAMVHTACAVPQIDWGLNLGNQFLAEDPVVRPITCQSGFAVCPIGSGLGVIVDERRLASFKA